MHHGGHHSAPDPVHAAPGHGGGPELSQIKGEIVKIFSEAEPKLNLGVKGDYVVVEKANDSDPHQQWIKDESWSNKTKDSAGNPGFALINRGTGKALTHPKKEGDKVHLTQYHQNSLDEQVLWSSAKAEKGYHALRSLSNIHLNLDIDHGSKKYGGVHDGDSVIVFKWKDEENQKWKLEPISTSTSSHDHHRR